MFQTFLSGHQLKLEQYVARFDEFMILHDLIGKADWTVLNSQQTKIWNLICKVKGSDEEQHCYLYSTICFSTKDSNLKVIEDLL